MRQVSFNSLATHTRSVQSLYMKWILDPVARIVTIGLIRFTPVNPITVTFLSLALSGCSAFFFYREQFVLAAMLFQVSVLLDAVDGLLARATGQGSVFGIVLDSYVDVARVLGNILALMVALQENTQIIILLSIFLCLNFAESFIDHAFSSVALFLRKKKGIVLNRKDLFWLRLRDSLKKRGLKVIFLHYHERILFVLFLGPVTGMFTLFSWLGILITLVSIHIKLFFDVALVKNGIVQGKSEYLRSTTGIEAEA